MIRFVSDFEPLGHLEFADPVAVLAAQSAAEVRAVLRAVEEAAAGGRWAAGYVTYEAAPAFDPALRVREPLRGPLAWFALFERPQQSTSRPCGEARLSALGADLSRRDHERAVEAIRAALGGGAAYQVNLTFRMHGRFEGDPLALYQRLRAVQGRCCGALLQTGSRAIVSASPELFFQRRGDRLVTRPMKGTALRGRFAEEDDQAAAALARSEKDRAENVMITDLMRNDVGRVARTGTVRVADLFAVERYRTVLQMTSTVEGRLAPDMGLDAIFGALFPCGSVTGAPKPSAMALIAQLEQSARGIYCGAMGVVAPGGEASFNVAIRTLDLDLDTGEAIYGTGGGITWHSSPRAEWDEALAKAAILTEPHSPFQLLETMRFEGGACLRFERHLARLESSARHLGFRFDLPSIRLALERAGKAFPTEGRRLRLMLSQDGSAAAETAPLPPQAGEPLPVALARTPVASRDWHLFHKTTRRGTYESRRSERPDAFDVVLQNESGDLTELTIGNLIAEIGGERITPPREAGLLPGVFRGELLERGEIRERPLRASDLQKAGRLWLVNSLRGWVPIRLS